MACCLDHVTSVREEACDNVGPVQQPTPKKPSLPLSFASVSVRPKPETDGKRCGVYVTRDCKAGEVLIQEAPILTYDPRNKKRQQADVLKYGKPPPILTREMRLPYMWIRDQRSDTHLHKLSLTDKTELLPEREFLQDLEQWSETHKDHVYRTYHKRCFTDVLLLTQSFPKVSMQMLMRVGNIMDAYTLPIQTPLSSTMNGAFLCSGLGAVSRLEHSCRPNAIYLLEDTEGDSFNVRVVAMHDLRAGDELTISYIGSGFEYDNLAERRARIEELLGFECTCHVCRIESELTGVPLKSVEAEAALAREAAASRAATTDDCRESTLAITWTPAPPPKTRRQKNQSDAEIAEAEKHAASEAKNAKEREVVLVPNVSNTLPLDDMTQSELFHQPLVQQLAKVLPGSANASRRKQMRNLMRSLDQHLLRRDQGTDLVLFECWQLMPLLLVLGGKDDDKKDPWFAGTPALWDGLDTWRWWVHKYLDLFLCSFLEHGFKRPVRAKRAGGRKLKKAKKVYKWMLPPVELDAFLTQLVLQQQDGRLALPFRLRILLAAVFTLLKQESEPEQFCFQGEHSPLLPPDETEPPQSPLVPDLSSGCCLATPEEAQKQAAAEQEAKEASDKAERTRVYMEQRDFRWAMTAEFFGRCLDALDVPRGPSNTALLVEIEAAHCFREWHESLLFAACAFDRVRQVTI